MRVAPLQPSSNAASTNASLWHGLSNATHYLPFASEGFAEYKQWRYWGYFVNKLPSAKIVYRICWPAAFILSIVFHYYPDIRTQYSLWVYCFFIMCYQTVAYRGNYINYANVKRKEFQLHTDLEEAKSNEDSYLLSELESLIQESIPARRYNLAKFIELVSFIGNLCVAFFAQHWSDEMVLWVYCLAGMFGYIFSEVRSDYIAAQNSLLDKALLQLLKYKAADGEGMTFLTKIDSSWKDLISSPSPTLSSVAHYAAWFNRLEMMNKLIEEKQPIDDANTSGNTPLHLAVLAGNFNIAEILRKAGADPDKQNLEGKTPAEMASSTTAPDQIVAAAQEANLTIVDISDSEASAGFMMTPPLS